MTLKLKRYMWGAPVILLEGKLNTKGVVIDLMMTDIIIKFISSLETMEDGIIGQ
jgi:hypothetical protein